MHFTGGEGCLEVEAKGLGREDVLPLLARGLYQHLRGVRRLLPQLLLGVLQLLAHPAAGFHPELFQVCLNDGHAEAQCQGPKGQQSQEEYFATVSLDRAAQREEQALEGSTQPEGSLQAPS